MSTRSHSSEPAGSRRTRPVRGGAEDLLTSELLRARKVSELQEMWGFWQNGQKPPSRKKELVEPLLASLTDGETVRSRIKVLSDRPREVLVRLARRDGYGAGLPELVDGSDGRDLETYEVEAAARALSKRGFVQVRRDRGDAGRGGETYVIPRDLGDLITGLLQEERRGPREVFSLTGHLASLPPAALREVLALVPDAPDVGADPAELARALVENVNGRGLLGRVGDETLRAVLWQAVTQFGGLMPRAEFESALEGDAGWDRAGLQEELERLGLGTVTTLALSDYGIDLEGETVTLFSAVTESVLDQARPQQAIDPECVDAAGVDLLTDLQQFLNLVASTPPRVTQGRTIYRAAQHRILESFIFHEDGLMDREGVFDLVYSLAFGLELVEVSDETRLMLTKRGELWDSVELTEKVRSIYGRFLEERLPEGRDFHVRRLRRALAAALADAPADTFLPLDDVPFRVRNDYLAALEDEGVKEQYKNRFQYTYTPPVETPADLRSDLVDYIVGRLYPLGVVDVALEHSEPVALSLTDLGRRLIMGERLILDDAAADVRADAARDAHPLVVNPDFEVLHFPEGDVNEVAHALSRFATRTKSEQVAHYRITRETIERAVVKGLEASEILEFLAAQARTPVPQNVAYSIREWAKRVRFAVQREGVVVTTTDGDAMDALLAVEDVRRLLVERLCPTAALLRASISDWKVLDTLRTLGVYFK